MRQATRLVEGATLGMWMDDWGLELGETVVVTDAGVDCLTQFDLAVHIIS